MHRQRGKCKEIFECKVAIADRVQTVGCDARKTEVARKGLAIDGERTSGKRAGSEWACVGTQSRRQEALCVAIECFSVRKQPMRKKNWLGVLHMSGARHGNAEVPLCLLGNCAFE